MVANFSDSSESDPPNKATYAAKTPPAIVAIPPVIKHINSDFVIFFIYGLTSRGASVWPKKIFPAADKDSAPDNFIVFDMTHAIDLTIT